MKLSITIIVLALLSLCTAANLNRKKQVAVVTPGYVPVTYVSTVSTYVPYSLYTYPYYYDIFGYPYTYDPWLYPVGVPVVGLVGRKTPGDQKSERKTPTLKEVEKELATLKKNVFGSEDFSTKKIREENSAYSSDWLAKQAKITRALQLEDYIKNRKSKRDDEDEITHEEKDKSGAQTETTGNTSTETTFSTQPLSQTTQAPGNKLNTQEPSNTEKNSPPVVPEVAASKTPTRKSALSAKTSKKAKTVTQNEDDDETQDNTTTTNAGASMGDTAGAAMSVLISSGTRIDPKTADNNTPVNSEKAAQKKRDEEVMNTYGSDVAMEKELNKKLAEGKAKKGDKLDDNDKKDKEAKIAQPAFPSPVSTATMSSSSN